MLDLQVSSILARLDLIQRELVAITDAYSGTGSGYRVSDACDSARLHVNRAATTLIAAINPSGVPRATERTTCPHCGFTKGSAACQAQHP